MPRKLKIQKRNGMEFDFRAGKPMMDVRERVQGTGYLDYHHCLEPRARPVARLRTVR